MLIVIFSASLGYTHEIACMDRSQEDATAVMDYPGEVDEMHGVTITIPHSDYSQVEADRAHFIAWAIARAHNPQYTIGPKSILQFIQDCSENCDPAMLNHNITQGLVDYLDECRCLRYDRITKPYIRGQFEEALACHYPRFRGKDITITSLGSAYFFSTIVKVINLMSHKPRSLVINLIDTASGYQVLIDFLNKFKNRKLEAIHYFARDENGGLIDAIESLPNYADLRNLYNKDEDEKDDYIAGKLKYRLKGLVQVIRFLAYVNDTCHISSKLVIYNDSRDYREDIDLGRTARSDILLIEDLGIDEYQEVIVNSLRDLLLDGGIYGVLMDEILQENRIKQAAIRLSLHNPLLTIEQQQIFINSSPWNGILRNYPLWSDNFFNCIPCVKDLCLREHVDENTGQKKRNLHSIRGFVGYKDQYLRTKLLLASNPGHSLHS